MVTKNEHWGSQILSQYKNHYYIIKAVIIMVKALLAHLMSFRCFLLQQSGSPHDISNYTHNPHILFIFITTTPRVYAMILQWLH